MHSSFIFTAILALSTSVFALPTVDISQDVSAVLDVRASTNVNPNSVTGTKCINKAAKVDTHDANVAQLAICGSIAGKITKCNGNPKSTTGKSGTALFTLNPTTAGASINVSKGRWEGCIRAARAVCPTGTFSSTCIGGASTGNIAFTLTNP